MTAMTLVSILIAVLVVCVVIWGTKSLTSAFKVGEPIATVILVIVVLLCLVLLLRQINLPRVLTRGQTSAVPRSVPR